MAALNHVRRAGRVRSLLPDTDHDSRSNLVPDCIIPFFTSLHTNIQVNSSVSLNLKPFEI